ncbi:MAG: alpha/beta fold hydrolase [Pseudomonadota bacterium]
MFAGIVVITGPGEYTVMADVQLHRITLAGTPAAGSQPWQPRLQLLAQAPATTDRNRPVLYVHGATFPTENAFFFRFGGTSWADALNAAGFPAWGLDFAGYGRSDAYPAMAAETPPAGEPLGRAPEAADQVARAVHAILAETGATRVSIIAHSWGTMVASRFAGDHPDLVDRLVLFGPVVRRETLDVAPPFGPWRFITVAEQKARFTEDVPQGEAGVLLEADFPAWADLYLKADPTSALRTPPSVKTPNGPIADIMAAWSGRLAYDPARVRAPVLIARGEWDSLCSDADVAWLRQALSAAPEVSDVKIAKATHLMHLETARTALYAAAIGFLQAA